MLHSPPDNREGSPISSHGRIRFADFELDARAAELYRHGTRTKVQEQPLQILALLLDHPGELVTRDELRQRLWPADTFVDFDHGLNKAVNKLREALGESADKPRFIETVPRRGYRFIGKVEPATPSERGDAPGNTDPRVGLILGLIAGAASILAVVTYLALRQNSPGAGATGRIMLAVLPFENLSGDPEQEYFSDGLTEEMIARLGSLRPDRIGVIARTSAMLYKHTEKRADQIGSELGVQFLLEGTVRRSEERVRITAQLIQTSDQTHLWAETFERGREDIFAIQSEVAERIARSLAVELLPFGEVDRKGHPTTSSAAHEAYLKGRYFWNRRTEEGLEKGLRYFEEAIALDPDYAQAQVGVADSYIMLVNYGALPSRDALPRAIAAARKALEIDARLAEAHTSLTWSTWVHDLDWAAARDGFRRAIALNPSDPFAYQLHANYLTAAGESEEALVEMEKARELDPLSLPTSAVLAWHYLLARKPDRAIEQCRRTLELDPDFARAHSYLGWAYMQKGLYPEAVAAMEKARELFGESQSFDAKLGHAYALAGRVVEARGALARLVDLSRRSHVEADLIAKIYLALGEEEEALRWLEKSHADRSSHRVLFGVDPLLDPLRNDTRFEGIVTRVMGEGAVAVR